MYKNLLIRAAMSAAAIVIVLGISAAGGWFADQFMSVSDTASASIVSMDMPSAMAANMGSIELEAYNTMEETPVIASADEPTGSQETLAGGYIVGVRDGFIAVFTDNGNEIAWKETTSIPVNAFPPEEQARLTAGIRVESAAELARVLED